MNIQYPIPLRTQNTHTNYSKYEFKFKTQQGLFLSFLGGIPFLNSKKLAGAIILVSCLIPTELLPLIFSFYY